MLCYQKVLWSVGLLSGCLPEKEAGSGNHCLPFLTGSGDLLLIMLIFYHRCFVVLQTDFLPLFLNSWVGAFKDALSICCSCCGQLPQGQPGAAPGCVRAKHLAEPGSEKLMWPSWLSGGSCLFMNFSVSFPVTWKFDSCRTFGCTSCRVHAILGCILLTGVSSTYSCYSILSISLGFLLLFLNLFLLFCIPPMAVGHFSLESWNCYLAKSAVLSHQGKNIFPDPCCWSACVLKHDYCSLLLFLNLTNAATYVILPYINT